jgi:hypothetical protein
MAQPTPLKRPIPEEFPHDSSKLIKMQKTSTEDIDDTKELGPPQTGSHQDGEKDEQALEEDRVQDFVSKALHNMICVDEFVQ